MVTLLVAVILKLPCDHLLVRYILEVQELTLVLILLVIKTLARVARLGGKEAGLARGR